MNNLWKRQWWRTAGDSPSGTCDGEAHNATAQEAGTGNATDAADEKIDGEEKAFTQADIDRIVQQTIAKERKRAELAVQKARTEAERLAAMTMEERTEHARQERDEALKQREAELVRRELKATALASLGEKGLPASLIGCVSLESEESMQKTLAEAENALRKSVDAMVENRMRGAAPKGGAGNAPYLSVMRRAAGLKG